MLIANYDPINGWSAPEIKPYAPLLLDPASSCLHYSSNVFEGMKVSRIPLLPFFDCVLIERRMGQAYVGPDGTPRLFRPSKNMDRLTISAARVALPPFDSDALLILIKKLVIIDKRWIPSLPGYSLYIRPTIIGTRSSLGVVASDSAMLFVILSPTGPYFPIPSPLSLLSVGQCVRSWPGGTGGYKLASNYTQGFLPQQIAARRGFHQCLWLLGGDTITEAGAMNFFVVLKRDDGDLDVVTPPLDGTILPGLTREACLGLLKAHPDKTRLPNLPDTLTIHTHERTLTMTQLAQYHAQGRLSEAFVSGTAVIVAPVGRIGWEDEKKGDIALKEWEGAYGPVGRALWERLVDIQQGRVEWEGWSVPCV